MYWKIFSLSLCVFISGCSQIEEALLPVHEKFNKAFPPNAEVRVAEERLRAFLQEDKAATSSFEEQYASRLQLRALTCMQNLSIGRFDRLSSVKSLAVSRDCLDSQDVQLQQYLGIRQIAMRLSQPALRPLKPLGAPSNIPAAAGSPEVSSGIGTSGAGVAVLHGTRGEFTVIEIPSGKKISTLPSFSNYSHGLSLSPNGRIVAIQMSNSGVAFADTETGEKLWETKALNQFYAWLPKQEAALARDTKTGDLALIDLKTGSVGPYGVGLRNQSWALLTNENSGQILVGSYRQFSLIKNERTASGIEASIVKEFRIKQGSGVTSHTPTLMSGGKTIVFVSSTDLMKIDLESEEETSWKTGGAMTGRYAKLSETTLLVDVIEPGSIYTNPWVLDIEQATVSPVENREAKGILMELAGRTGFLRRTGGGIWIGDEVQAGQAVPLDGLLSEINLKRQLAQLEAQARMEQMAPHAGVPYTGAQSAPAAPASWAQAKPALNLAPDTQVEGVGVYQGTGVGARTAANGRKMGDVEVRVRRSGKPLVLVLSSYEPVRWILKPEPGAKLSAVLVSGYYSSEVSGAGSARVLVAGSTYAYKNDSPQYNALNQQTIKWTGKSIGTFQGKYEGSAFSVGY